MPKNILIVIGAIIVLLFILHISKLFTFTLEQPVKTYTRELKDYTVTTSSVLLYDKESTHYCDLVVNQYYENPSIILQNTKTGQIDKYIFKSKRRIGKIMINGGSTPVTKEYTNIHINYTDFTKGCNKVIYGGSVIVHNTGAITSLFAPPESVNTDISIYKNGKYYKTIQIAPPEVESWSSDFNADAQIDHIFFQPNAEGTSTKVYMIDEITNNFDTWFNEGEPVTTSEHVSAITDTYDSLRQFIHNYSH